MPAQDPAREAMPQRRIRDKLQRARRRIAGLVGRAVVDENETRPLAETPLSDKFVAEQQAKAPPRTSSFDRAVAETLAR